MKNKEIVKRLRDSLDYEFDLSFNERKELLSRIEQLENNKEKEYVLVGRMQLKTRDYIHQLEKEKRQLENNRDKAIEIINIEKSKMEYAKYDSCLLLIEQVLKGDSDA